MDFMTDGERPYCCNDMEKITGEVRFGKEGSEILELMELHHEIMKHTKKKEKQFSQLIFISSRILCRLCVPWSILINIC